MIDIDMAKQVFKQYINQYTTIDNKKISLKIAHMYRVCKLSKELAESLDLPEEDVQLAELIGLLHDIGRFEQIKIYNTFMDKASVNHGEYGVKVLFEDGLIEKFIKDRQYDEIIKKAILNHNRGEIENGLNERQILHCKLIKDADKTDILYLLNLENVQTIYGEEEISGKISRDILEQAFEEHRLDYQLIKNSADVLISHMMYPFNFYYDYGLKIIYKNDYLGTHIKKLKIKEKQTKQEVQELMEIITDYIQNRIKEGE